MTRFELSGRRALVTGATGGLGHAIARGLHHRSVELVLTGRRTDVLTPLAEELRASAITADLSAPGQLDRIVAEAGQIDILVLNAALPSSGDVLDFTEEQIERAVAVNIVSPALMARCFAEQMVSRGSGRIVFIGSMSGLAATRGTGVYSMTKFALRGLAHGMRQDLHGTGVGISIVQPGFVRDAGMFADTGLKPPPGAGTVAPKRVADAVLSCIEDNRGEINVAPLPLRAAAHLSGFAPALAARLARRMNADAHAAEFAERQKHKR